MPKNFLMNYQRDAVENMKNGCILNGKVGSGKSRTALYYYFVKVCGGGIDPNYISMKRPIKLYIITTAKKRDDNEWNAELCPFLLNDGSVTVDSWNNIKKYRDVTNSFFIFDEDRVTGSGAWVKAFLKIARSNHWIILSATAGDKWEDYIPVFVANGFYRNVSEFKREHLIYSRFSKYPKVERYLGTGRLNRLRRNILVDMDYTGKAVPHHEDVFVAYDIPKYKDIIRKRWDPWKDEPIQNAAGFCYALRHVVNADPDREVFLLELLEKHPKAIIFYNFDYELEILRRLCEGNGFEYAEWNGHKHQPVPDGEKWVYLVHYNAGSEGWNCIKTDTIIFWSQTYSYKTLVQACGRIDRANTPFSDLYYYHIKSRSGIDLAIAKALKNKKKFNERKFYEG